MRCEHQHTHRSKALDAAREKHDVGRVLMQIQAGRCGHGTTLIELQEYMHVHST